MSLKGTSDSLRLNHYFNNDAAGGYQLELIKFADGSSWDIAAVKTRVLTASAENDTLYGYATADTIAGLAGDDTLHARAGNDTLDGGSGEDTLNGEDGDDLLAGGAHGDRLDGGSGNDTLNGQDGDDTLYGQAGNDILDGGIGNDSLNGGSGNDVYLFGKGSGKDVISAHDSTVGKLDAIVFAADVLASDVVVQKEGDHLVLSLKGSSDSLRVSNYFYGNAAGGYQVEQIKFDDGTIWDLNAIRVKVGIPAVTAGATVATVAEVDAAHPATAGADATAAIASTNPGVLEVQPYYRYARLDQDLLFREVAFEGDAAIPAQHQQVAAAAAGAGDNGMGAQIDALVSAMAAFAPPAAAETTLTAAAQANQHPVMSVDWR